MKFPIIEDMAAWLKIVAHVDNRKGQCYLPKSQVRDTIRKVLTLRYRHLLSRHHITGNSKQAYSADIEKLIGIEVNLCMARIPTDLQGRGTHLLPHQDEWVFVGFSVPEELQQKRTTQYAQLLPQYLEGYQDLWNRLLEANTKRYSGFTT